MSNILDDIHRQSIARSIIDTIKPQSYVDVGCYQGASMGWWDQIGQIPNLFGCDVNPTAMEECKRRCSRALLVESDSRQYLRMCEPWPEPVIFYLDTDWTDNPVKGEEMAAIIDRLCMTRMGDFVIVANAINQPGHPLYKNSAKPWGAIEFFEAFGEYFKQFIVPNYSHPQLANGYAVLNYTDRDIPFDPKFFRDFHKGQ